MKICETSLCWLSKLSMFYKLFAYTQSCSVQKFRVGSVRKAKHLDTRIICGVPLRKINHSVVQGQSIGLKVRILITRLWIFFFQNEVWNVSILPKNHRNSWLKSQHMIQAYACPWFLLLLTSRANLENLKRLQHLTDLK